jgi:PAS domain-containing protein
VLQLEQFLNLPDLFVFIEEKIGIGIWRIDAAGQMQWSRGVFSLLGLDPRRTTPSFAAYERRIHPEDRRSPGAPGEFLFDRSLFDGEFRIIRPAGSLRWIRVESEVLLDSAGEPDCVLGVAIDITEQHRLLQPFKEDAGRYAALSQVVDGLLWIGNSDGRITALVNGPKISEADKFLGRGWVDLVHEEEREAALKSWATAAETGRPYNVEHRLRQPDGSYRLHRCKAVPVVHSDGSIREWLGTSTDMQQPQLSIQHGATSRLTGAQLRAARGMLNWSVKQLAARTGISAAVIRGLEERHGFLRLPEETLSTLRDTLSGAGIEFIFPAVGQPGVRPR